jgi:hypothetical protein
MNIRAKLTARLSRFSPLTMYAIGLVDGAILTTVAFVAGFLISKVTH